jgi:hypothetical protein
MPQGDQDTEVGFGRTQPEFSLGERMATIETAQKKDEQYEAIVAKLEEKLNDQKLDNVRTDMDTKDKARQEAILKAEKAAAEAAIALATEFRQTSDNTQTRLGALERGGAGGMGEKVGTGEREVREYTRRLEFRSNLTLAILVATLVLAALTGHLH